MSTPGSDVDAHEVWAIVVAAGAGARFGGAKQFAALGSDSVLDLSVAAAGAAADGVIVVVPPESQWVPPDGVAVVTGGSTRAESVRRGLAAAPSSAAIMVVHDGARPLASPALFATVIDAVRDGADAAIPGVAVADTLKRVDDVGRVCATVPRDGMVAVQTPQAFRASVLVRAHRSGGDATDDAALVEAIGGTVVVVPGDPTNLKLTTPEDLVIAAAILAARGE